MLNDNPDCHLEIGYDEELAHLIYAGADLLVMPSLYEPCGLTQMIAMRYGTVPVVRAVGGLKDTVFDWDHSPLPREQRNGFVFEHPTTPASSRRSTARSGGGATSPRCSASSRCRAWRTTIRGTTPARATSTSTSSSATGRRCHDSVPECVDGLPNLSGFEEQVGARDRRGPGAPGLPRGQRHRVRAGQKRLRDRAAHAPAAGSGGRRASCGRPR